MRNRLLVFLLIFYNIGFAICGYPPMGDEVQAGSVLLPASRRGRYLANIVRRQAVDGTGIKFNKDADRMNAEAKKKVDVLSEELLPYIIAEQERRTTLYKRVMTAIQNGEKGVTVAEIRNKPPAIIRKGLMYRCPTNRAPREPDGSGVIMCEENIDPTPIMFESCLSAEDKELYVADNRYFFCNRHKIEGPDLPRNGTSVIGCAPCERTSLNYTSQKCALEDTDDVVVHYRYYPDRTYKFVSELDPDREVCEHWNPCQVGYIFSLPGPDQATPASELWHDYKIVPQDDKNETVFPAHSYTTSPRKVRVPDGYFFHGVGKYMPNGLRTRISTGDVVVAEADNMQVNVESIGNYVKITLTFRPLKDSDATTYYARFEDRKPALRSKSNFIHIPLVTLAMGQTRLTPLVIEVLAAQRLNVTNIYFTCNRCVLHGIMLRGADGSVRNVDVDRYRLRKFTDEKGVEQSDIEMEFDIISPRDFGDYFLMIQNEDGSEERMKAITLKLIEFTRLRLAANVGQHVDQSLKYGCKDCELTDVQCNGESVISQGRVAIIPIAKSLNINFVGFEDVNACVYMGIFKIKDSTVRKILAILETVTVSAERVDPPQEGIFFERIVKFKCAGECSIEKISVNGIPLETTSRRSDTGSVAFYLPRDSEVKIGITQYSDVYEGVFQAVFLADGEQVTKNLMEIGPEIDEATGPKPDKDKKDVNLNADDNKDSDADKDSEKEKITDENGDTPKDDSPKTEEDADKDKTPKEGDDTQNGDDKKEGEEENKPETDPETEPETETEPEVEPDAETENEPERRQQKKTPGIHHNGTKTGKPEKLAECSVHSLRDSVQTGHAYNKLVQYVCPGGALVSVSCRGHNVTAGLSISTNNTVNIDFANFEDANACVYMGVFKIGKTEHKKTLAVLEMVNVTLSAVVPPPPAGQLNHTVVYTCNITKCDPEKIYINDKTLKSDDKNPVYSFKSQKEKDKEVTTVTIDFAIKPFSKDLEGVYQLELTDGTQKITKNIMEVGSVA